MSDVPGTPLSFSYHGMTRSNCQGGPAPTSPDLPPHGTCQSRPTDLPVLGDTLPSAAGSPYVRVCVDDASDGNSAGTNWDKDAARRSGKTAGAAATGGELPSGQRTLSRHLLLRRRAVTVSVSSCCSKGSLAWYLCVCFISCVFISSRVCIFSNNCHAIASRGPWGTCEFFFPLSFFFLLSKLGREGWPPKHTRKPQSRQSDVGRPALRKSCSFYFVRLCVRERGRLKGIVFGFYACGPAS